MTELRDGVRVKVKNSLLYAGRIGTLEECGYSFWDWHVRLDEEPPLSSRVIGVDRSQVEMLP